MGKPNSTASIRRHGGIREFVILSSPGSAGGKQRRSRKLCERITREAWSAKVAVAHWGFIKAVTGLDVANGAALQIDPT